MKQGKSLTELAAEIERQKTAKRDFVADTRRLKMVPLFQKGMDEAELSSGIELEFARKSQNLRFPINELAHSQIAQRLKIPGQYYSRMRTEHPVLLRENVNSWFERKPEKRMVRTLDGNVRAFLSDRYNPLDYFDMLEAVLPMVAELKLEIKSCEVTERRLFIKAINVHANTRARWVHGDGSGPNDLKETYQPGIVIGNSEVGCGSVFVSPGIVTVECTNLAFWNKAGLRRYHVGHRIESEETDISDYLTDETKIADDKAFWLKFRDMMHASLAGQLYNDLVDKMMAAADDKIETEIPRVVEVTGERFQLTGTESDGVLQFLITGGDLTRIGLSQAITRFSANVDSYDRASELEAIGAGVIELKPKEWQTIQNQASKRKDTAAA